MASAVNGRQMRMLVEKNKTYRTLMAIPLAPCVYGLFLLGLRLLSDPRGKQSHAVSVCHVINIKIIIKNKYSILFKCHTCGYAPSSLLFSLSAPVYVHVRVPASRKKTNTFQFNVLRLISRLRKFEDTSINQYCSSKGQNITTKKWIKRQWAGS